MSSGHISAEETAELFWASNEERKGMKVYVLMSYNSFDHGDLIDVYASRAYAEEMAELWESKDDPEIAYTCVYERTVVDSILDDTGVENGKEQED